MTATEYTTVDHAVQAALNVPGWCEPDELRWLAEQAAALPKNGLIIEVGSWQGRSASALARAMPPTGKLICIDTWAGSAEDPGPAPDGTPPPRGTRKVPPVKLWHAFNAHLADQLFENRVIALRLTSILAASRFAPDIADLVFIDGSHTAAAVRLDILSWLPKVAPGGLLVLHDYFEDGAVCPDVKRVADAMLSGIERGPGTLVYWRRGSP
jgi:predicted O-methyltransferase YrrM